MKPRTILILILNALFSLRMDASVVVDTNVTLGDDHFGQFADHWLTVLQNEAGDYTTMWFDKTELQSGVGSLLNPVTWNIDEEADYYLAPEEAAFSVATIAAGQFSRFFVLDHPTPIEVSYGDFYLGINTGVGWSESSPSRDVFGWVHLRNTSTGLEMLGNAMAYDTQGIYIGTMDVIPEPATWKLAGAAILFYLFSRINSFSKRQINTQERTSFLDNGGRDNGSGQWGSSLHIQELTWRY